MCVFVRVVSVGGWDVWVWVNVEEDVSLVLVLCFEVVEDGSRYLYVMVLFMYNVDNGECYFYLFLGFRLLFMSFVEFYNLWFVMRFGFLFMIFDEILNLCWEFLIWWGVIGIDWIVGWWFLDYMNFFNFYFEFL